MTQRREFLQLAKTFQPTRSKVGGWYLSEKLDGTRCLWDGGISRGIPLDQVPWALHKKEMLFSTGLWDRNCRPIAAPDNFLDKLPPFICDGELWAGRGNKNLCIGVASRNLPKANFMDIYQFAIFSSPPIEKFFQTGLFKTKTAEIQFDFQEIKAWLAFNKAEVMSPDKHANFEQELFALRGWSGWDDQVYILKQIVLPNDNDKAAAELGRHVNKIIDEGGEGIVLRDPGSVWQPRRTNKLLKFKTKVDDEKIEENKSEFTGEV